MFALDYQQQVTIVYRFYWVIENVLAGCSRPGAPRGDVDRDLATLRDHGIGALLTLTEQPLPSGALERHDITGLHLPVDYFHGPTITQILEALAFLDDARAASMPAAVHCLAGQGRTGTVLAAYLIRGGLSATAAITEVRSICPGAIESERQREALLVWENDRPWLI